MKYLFDVEDILTDREEQKVLTLDFFELPEGMEIPTLTVKINEVTRNAFKQATKKYSGIKDRVSYSSKGVAAVLTNDPERFCIMVLQSAYEDSSGFFEHPTKEAIIKLCEKEAKFVRRLASMLVEAFEHNELFKKDEEEEDKKN